MQAFSKNFKQKMQDIIHQSKANPSEIPQNNTDISFILRKRLERICSEIDIFHYVIELFAQTFDEELLNFTNNMTQLHINLNNVHLAREVQRSPDRRRPSNEGGSQVRRKSPK